jgi:hypothetical protein
MDVHDEVDVLGRDRSAVRISPSACRASGKRINAGQSILDAALDGAMPIRDPHRRRLRVASGALLGAVTDGVLLAACGDATPPPASPPGTTRPIHPRASTTTAGTRGALLMGVQ